MFDRFDDDPVKHPKMDIPINLNEYLYLCDVDSFRKIDDAMNGRPLPPIVQNFIVSLPSDPIAPFSLSHRRRITLVIKSITLQYTSDV